jgi:ribosome-associated heat shock protein Hsp15|tara:strand:+ start:784 stop:1158 length:375 start_codon:yes stop_codon:yes gene_type:complete
VTDPVDKLRVDKWLWQARFFKTRSLASGTVRAGHLRVNGQKVSKPATNVKLGDVLTFAQGRDVRVVKLRAIGSRRGPASEAQTLYHDLTPEREKHPQAPRFEGKGRPSKQDRRNLDLYNRRTLE